MGSMLLKHNKNIIIYCIPSNIIDLSMIESNWFLWNKIWKKRINNYYKIDIDAITQINSWEEHREVREKDTQSIIFVG